mmetsp:Transcript_117753/g.327975  ORF Transcript_117753/g.327975 Transcript_117753/m.327975 type:complete len:222 (+) Transcript_117753:1021-1686(+)
MSAWFKRTPGPVRKYPRLPKTSWPAPKLTAPIFSSSSKCGRKPSVMYLMPEKSRGTPHVAVTSLSLSSSWDTGTESCTRFPIPPSFLSRCSRRSSDSLSSAALSSSSFVFCATRSSQASWPLDAFLRSVMVACTLPISLRFWSVLYLAVIHCLSNSMTWSTSSGPRKRRRSDSRTRSGSPPLSFRSSSMPMVIALDLAGAAACQLRSARRRIWAGGASGPG